GDGAAACVAGRCTLAGDCLALLDVELGVDGAAADLLRVHGSGRGGVRILMDGPRLAGRAVETLAELVRDCAERHRLKLDDLAGVLIHGGNGRLPELVARRLGLPEEKVW